MKKILTLVFFIQDNQILLGYKKIGFGSNRWNGFGGKVEKDEAIEEAAKREVLEECGLKVLELEKRAIHQFSFNHNDDILEVHTFLATRWEGTVTESAEMKPEWFSLGNIPYDAMWPDDILWLPRFLEGKFLLTRFLFGENDQVLDHDIQEVLPANL